MGQQSIQKETVFDLVRVVQDLSLSRNMEEIMEVVRKAARQLTGADGATFVLREGEQSYYADEDAIAPLWKGCRFPMSACISGWSMINREPAVIEDIFQDPRIPKDIYRPTFVKSLVMMPIRRQDPLGAIGTYWADLHAPGEEEVELLRSLADVTSVAISNINIHNDLENKVKERTKRLEAFTYSVAHELKNPLAGMEMRLNSLEGESADQSEEFQEVTEDLREAIARMNGMIDGLLQLSQLGNEGVHPERCDMKGMVERVIANVKNEEHYQGIRIEVGDLPMEYLDPTLFQRVWRNLISNSIKFTKDRTDPWIEVGMEERKGDRVYWVADNGCGFREDKASEIFKPFNKLHNSEGHGSGIGLSMVQQIVLQHGGTIWAEGASDKGATFLFSLPRRLDQGAIESTGN